MAPLHVRAGLFGGTIAPTRQELLAGVVANAHSLLLQ